MQVVSNAAGHLTPVLSVRPTSPSPRCLLPSVSVDEEDDDSRLVAVSNGRTSKFSTQFRSDIAPYIVSRSYRENYFRSLPRANVAPTIKPFSAAKQLGLFTRPTGNGANKFSRFAHSNTFRSTVSVSAGHHYYSPTQEKVGKQAEPSKLSLETTYVT